MNSKRKTTSDRRPAARVSIGLLTQAAVICLATSASAGRFNGFQANFNLGLSPATNLVCAATRTYDVAAGHGVRAWSVTCRGLGDRALGTVYVFGGADRARVASAWAARLAQDYDCAAAGPPSGQAGSRVCANKATGAQYEFETRAASGRRILVVGNKSIQDLLRVAADYAAGAIDEPDVRKVANYSVASISSTDLTEILDQGPVGNTASRLRKAYQLNYDWDFERAEDTFSALAKSGGSENKAAAEVESLYNLALNASNNRQADFAQFTFEQADKRAKEAGLEGLFKGLSLNYAAILLRNKGAFEDAKTAALMAITQRAQSAASGPIERRGQDLEILAGEQDVDNGKLSERDRNALLDAQAYQVAATSMEALGNRPEAADLLDKATKILSRFGDTGTGFKSRPLGEAVPWLNLRVQADALRLNRLTNRAVDLAAFRRALNAFQRVDGPSLPLAASIMELASAESALKGQQDQALKDYETAFAIFREKRGALGPSADFAAGYFRILLDRIGSGGDRDEATQRFFLAAQTLTNQSSVNAARKANAQRNTADPKVALLARQLETTEADIDAQKIALAAAQVRNDQAAAKTAETELLRLAKEANDVLDRLREQDPGYAGRLQTSISLTDLKTALSPGEAYVKAFLLSGQGFGIVITHDTATPYPIALSRKDGRCLVEAFRSSIAKNADWDEDCKIVRLRENGENSLYQFDIGAAAQLFDAIFGPVRTQVLASKSLIFEPDATLIGAPIPAMVVDKASSLKVLEANRRALGVQAVRLSYLGVDWLGDHVPSVVALDAATFVGLRNTKPSKAEASYLGFGNPQIIRDPAAYFNIGNRDQQCKSDREKLSRLNSLPDTAGEVSFVSDIFGKPPNSIYRVGQEFTDGWITKASAENKLKDFKILYFATHGISKPDDPCLGVALLTSVGSDGGDGLLRDDEILKLKLDADMVVLSACDTGITKEGGSEAVGGLVRSFFIASARNLVVSNWSVNSKSTALLMKNLFGSGANSQVEALAFAERKLSHDISWSHPYYWAGFSLVGDGMKIIPVFQTPNTVGGL